nr:hypothetical protein [Tanacetum cinerariifolium]
MCLSQDENNVVTSLVVVHPLRKECYELPSLLMRFDSSMLRESRGLGFDASTDTLKMVCVLFKECAPINSLDKVTKKLCTMAHVFGTNSWREVAQVPPYSITNGAIYANSCLHWLVSYLEVKNKDNSGRPIICFDVEKEEFELTDPPKRMCGTWRNYSCYYDHLVDLNDSVVRTSVPIITIATTTPTVDPAAIAKEKLVGSSIFGADSPSAGESHPIPSENLRSSMKCDEWVLFGVCREMVDEFSPSKFFATVHGMDHDQLFTEFNVGVARQISLSTEVRMRAEYNLKERMRLNYMVEEKDSLLNSRCEEIESLKAQLLVKETEAMEPVHLRAEASKFAIVEKSLRDEKQVLKERNATLEKQKSELEIQVTDLAASVKVREQEVADLDAVVTFVKLQNDSLADQVYKLKTSSAGLQEKVTVYEGYMSQLEKFQDEKMEEANEKFDKLCIDFVDMALHLEEKFYPHLLTTIFGHRWLLTHNMDISVDMAKCLNCTGYGYLPMTWIPFPDFVDMAKCLNSTGYLCALGTAIGKAIEKEQKSQFPVLAAMAFDLLTVQASVVASESAFSVSGRVISPRTKLTLLAVKVCICLKYHLDSVERIQNISPLEGDMLQVEEEIHEKEIAMGLSVPPTT